MAGSLPIAKIKEISKLVEEKGVEEARKELISSGMITKKEIEENQEKANARETYVNPYEKKMRDIATGFKIVSDIGVGALKGAESIADAVSTGIGYGASGIQSLWDKEGAEKTKDYWKKLTEVDVIEDTLGKAVDNVYTKNSLIGRGNNTLDTADSLIEGTSEMIPSIILGNGAAGAVGKLGLAAKATSAAETANKAAKVYQLADKATRSVANTIPFMIQSTGSGINEALDEGASYDDATKYGVASGIAEGAIEGFSGGIGGIASNKILSKVFSNPEVSSALGKFVSSNIGKFVTKAGDIAIDAAGEGLEEVISGIINPYIKRLTYDEQAELANSEELIQQFTGGAIGSLLMKAGYSAANSDFSVKNTINNVKEKINSKKTKIDTNTELINNSSNIEQNSTQENYAELPPNTNQNLSNTYENNSNNTNSNQNTTNLGNIISNQNVTNSNYIDELTSKINNILPEESQIKTEYAELPNKVNSKYANDTITLNKNNVTTENLGHELTHHLMQQKGYENLSDHILTELDKSGQLESMKQEVINAYAPVYNQENRVLTDSDVEAEIVAKYSEKLFSDEETINRLTQSNRNLVQKVYDWVVDKINYYKTVKNMSVEQKQEYDTLRKAEKLYRKAMESKKAPQIVTDFQTNINQVAENNFNVVEIASSSSNKQQIIDIINSNKNFDSSMKQNLISGVQQINNLDNNTYNSFLNQIEEINQEYNNFATSKKEAKVKYNSKIVEEATNTVPSNKQGKRTKSEWLKVAEQIGINVENKAELQQYAEKSWSQLHPNIADNLNRQGQKYVKFTKQEWINAVTKSSNLKYSITGSKNNSNLFNENKIVNENIKGYSDEIKYDSENFAKQVDSVKNGTFPQRDMLTLGRTPKVLRELGLNDLPITMTQKHLETIMNETGKYKNSNYHGLGEDIVKKLPEALNNPLDILKSSSKEDSIVLTTDLSDKQDRTIIASIKIDGKGNVNDVRIDTNVMTSAYGRNNYDKFMQDNIKAGNLLYDIDQGIIKKIDKKTVGERLQLPMRDSSDVRQNSSENISINNIIPQNEKYATSNEKKLNPLEISNLTTDNVKTAQTNNSDIKYSLEKDQRKHYETVKNSSMVDKFGQNISENLLEKDRYIPLKNQKAIDDVDYKLSKNGLNSSLTEFRNKLNSKERLTVNDIAMGERLIQEYSKIGDFKTTTELIQDVAILGTELGQQVQAMSLINKMSPTGQLQLIEKTINRLNSTEKNLKSEIKISDDIKQEILKADTAEKLDKAVCKATKSIAEQLPVSASDKVRSWRYLCMLGNPTTHIRNILSNVAMKGTMGAKNVISGAIEDVVNPSERTKTLKRASTETKNFAKADAEKMQSRLSDGGIEDVMSKVKMNKRDFDNKVLNTVSQFNSNMLEKEDWIFLKSAYQSSLANYMTANNLTSEYLSKGTKESNIALEKAREYSINAAQEATFRQYSKLASWLNKIENINGVTKVAVGGAVPFKKTPVNIAKAGVEYSPIGLFKTLTKNTYDLNKGKISVNKYIDNISKGLTGTALVGIGMALANAGILNASGSDDEKEANYSEELGNQSYSIKIGDSTYTLDWLSPTAMPLFVGAELSNALKKGESINLNNLTDATLKTLNPLMEMSMVQSLASALTSYNSDGTSGKLSDIAINVAESYVGQFIPTLSGKVARIVDDTERNTYYSDKTGIERDLERFKNKIIAKIPVASMNLQPKTDIWGEEVKRNSNIAARAFDNLVAPYYKKEIKESKVDTEIQRVYKETNEDVLPTIPNGQVTLNKNKYTLTPKEYTEYKKTYGTEAKKRLSEVIKTKEYKQLSDEEKSKIIQSVYTTAKETSKGEYAEAKSIKYDVSKSEAKIQNLVKNGLSLVNSYIYRGEISKIEGTKASNGKTISGSINGNKAKYIMNMNTDSNQKNKLLSLLNDSEKTKDVTVSDLSKVDKSSYTTFFGLSGTEDSKGYSQRDKYLMLRDMNIKSSELDKYFTEVGNIKSEKDSDGKAITDSKKIKVLNYICELDIEPLQKITLFAKSGYTDDTEELVFEYLSEKNLTTKRKLEIMSMLYD